MIANQKEKPGARCINDYTLQLPVVWESRRTPWLVVSMKLSELSNFGIHRNNGIEIVCCCVEFKMIADVVSVILLVR